MNEEERTKQPFSSYSFFSGEEEGEKALFFFLLLLLRPPPPPSSPQKRRIEDDALLLPLFSAGERFALIASDNERKKGATDPPFTDRFNSRLVRPTLFTVTFSAQKTSKVKKEVYVPFIPQGRRRDKSAKIESGAEAKKGGIKSATTAQLPPDLPSLSWRHKIGGEKREEEG